MRDTDVLIDGMQDSRVPPNEQTLSDPVLPAIKETENETNNRNRNRRSDRSASSEVSASIPLDDAATNRIGDSDFSEDRESSKSSTKRAEDLHLEPREAKSSRPAKRIKTRPGVTQLKDGRFKTRVELPRGPSGERRRKYFTAKTQQEALDKKQRYLTNLSRHIVPEGSFRKFADFANWWIKEIAPQTCNATTILNYRTNLDLHINPVIGHMTLQEVRGFHVDVVVTSMAEKGLALNSRKAARRVISTVFAEARRRDLVDDNPVTRSRPPRLIPGETMRERKTLTTDQIIQVKNALAGHPYELYFKLIMFTGLRRGEALAITWDDISTNDGEHYTVYVSQQVKEVTVRAPDGVSATELRFDSPKTANGIRVVEIPNSLFKELERTRPRNAKGDQLIFQTSNGGPLWPSNVTNAWRKFAKSQGLTGVRLHDLRHSFARNALEAGAPLEAVSEVLGHYSINITKDVYASTVRGAARKVAGPLFDKLNESDALQSLERSLALTDNDPG